MKKCRAFLVSLIFLIPLYFACTDFFSLSSIAGPLLAPSSPILSEEAKDALSHRYRYLGKGKQSFAFISENGKWVIKFFNQKYHKLPFYAAWMKKERAKRERRGQFYRESYLLAAKMLPEETGIVYLHMGPTVDPLPILDVVDRRGKEHRVDLNQMPFVLQKKAEPFYPALNSFPIEKGIEQFIAVIASRIEKKIGDADHDVEHNFGICEGRVILLDPGRFYLEEQLWEPKQLKHEWWSATHRFRIWLQKEYPQSIPFFDETLERAARLESRPSGRAQASHLGSCEKELSALFRSGESPFSQEEVLQKGKKQCRSSDVSNPL